MLLSLFIWSGAPFFLIPPIIFFGIINNIFIPFEENRLSCLFKGEYKSYSVKIRRWI
jgi:protein-S-isoprenylcysteine O-methyltransferase Ste14